MPDHLPDCAWEQTAPDECVYRDTHHYCPHSEHACTCPPKPTVADELALALRLLDAFVQTTPCWHHQDNDNDCLIHPAQALLVRHGIRGA